MQPPRLDPLETLCWPPACCWPAALIWLEIATLKTWTDLCGLVRPSERLRDLISLRDIVVERMRRLSTYSHLEGTTYALLESLDPYLSELSSEVALRLYDKARWVACTLDSLTYYTRQELPLLGEAVQHIKPPSEAFFQYSVARLRTSKGPLKTFKVILNISVISARRTSSSRSHRRPGIRR